MPTDFTIVGGGIGGLVTARRLAQAGRSVMLLEASDRLGGTVAGHEVAGIELDAGAESFATRAGTVAALAQELGLGPDIVQPAEPGAWLQPATGHAVPLPAAGLLGIPGTPLAADVIKVIGMPAAMRAELDAVIPYLGTGAATTLGALVRRRMGRAVLEKLVAPVVYGVHSVHPDDIPLDRAAPGLRAALGMQGSLAAAVRSLRAAAPAGSAIAGIRGGMHRLAEELEADLTTRAVDVQLGRRVTAIDGLPGTVIVAAPGVLASANGRKVVLATLVVESGELDTSPRGTGVLVAAGAEGIRARALTHATAKWEWLRERAAGRHVLRLSYDSEPENLEQAAREDAERLLDVSLPAAAVQGFARVEWTRPTSQVTPPDGVVVVGETAAGSGLAAIVAHANAQADLLLSE